MIHLLHTFPIIIGTLLSIVLAGANNTTILNFDDIPTTHGMSNFPLPYQHLTFSSSSAFAPYDPALKNLITPHDLNCAISPPNALIGSRSSSSSPPASFTVNTTSLSEGGLYPYFTLHSFWIKPMDSPPPGCTVFVKGYDYKINETLEWNVEFPYGYYKPFLFKAREYTRREWEVYKVEIWGAFGEEGLDWEVCVDDLEVEFRKVEQKDGKGAGDQRVLG